MPELPDVTRYLDALERRVRGRRLHDVRLASPFLLRMVEPLSGAISGLTMHAQCQTGGRLLADRSLSRLLHADRPRTAEELEERRRPPSEQRET